MQKRCALLALHGFTGCGSDFEILKDACPKTFFWDAPDLHRAGVPAEIDQLCAFLKARWDALGTDTPRILLGYSMGGRIALHLAQKIAWQPSDKLVLISASPGIADTQERETRRRHDFALAGTIEATASAKDFYATWEKTPLIATQTHMPAAWRKRILQARASADKQAWANALRTLGTGTLAPLWGELQTILAETILISGENDAKFSQIAGTMAEKFPHAHHYIVPACGHAPHFEKASAVAEQITDNASLYSRLRNLLF